jgi:hypothetical protein
MAEPSATQVAAQKLAELFKSPEDLSKIESFKSRFIRERSLVDAQLKAGIRAQLEITQVHHFLIIGSC